MMAVGDAAKGHAMAKRTLQSLGVCTLHCQISQPATRINQTGRRFFRDDLRHGAAVYTTAAYMFGIHRHARQAVPALPRHLGGHQRTRRRDRHCRRSAGLA